MELYSSAKGRRSMILRKIKTGENVEVNTLSKEFNVSKVTIRKDLNLLCSRKLIVRTHGGAIKGDTPIPSRAEVHVDSKRHHNYQQKQAIGLFAAGLIRDGDTVLIDSGTTTLEVAKNLQKFQRMTLITNAINITLELLKYKRFNVILIGGNMRETSQSSVGPLAESNLRMFYCDKLFLGVDSFSVENGLSTPDIEESHINQLMMSRAKSVIAVFDSSKIDKRALNFISHLDKITAIVTDDGMNHQLRRQIESMGITVHIA